MTLSLTINIVWSASLFLMHIICTSASKAFLTSSGRLLPLAAVHWHHPSVSKEDLAHLVFEYHTNGSLISHHAHINIHAIASHVAESPRTESSSQLFEAKNHAKSSSPPHNFRQGHGYTFVFEDESDGLVAAWGPALQLHPIHPTQYPATFINIAVLSSPTISTSQEDKVDRVSLSLSKSLAERAQYSSLKAIGGPIRCKQILVIFVLMRYDVHMRKLYGNDKNTVVALEGLIRHVADMYESSVCVTLRSYGYSGNPVENVPEPNRYCSEISDDLNCTQNAKQLLTYVASTLPSKQAVLYRHLYRNRRHATFLFTGLKDSSPLSGAAYLSPICSPELSLGWVKNGNAAVLAHEIGHMLGAQHDKEGFMSEIVQPDEKLVLSGKSKTEIMGFISNVPRSWCLRRSPAVTNDEIEKYWKSAIPQRPVLQMNWSMTTTLPFRENGPSDVFILGYYRNQSSLANDLILGVTTLPKIPCVNNISQEAGPCFPSLSVLNFTETPLSFGISVAVGRILNMTSTDLIVSYIGLRQNIPQAYYRASLGFSLLLGSPEKWSKPFKVEPFNSEKPQCSDITLGYIRGGSSPDIIFMHVDQRLFGSVIIYYVGFDVGPDGGVRGGWSDEIKVPNWAALHISGISIEVYDIDHNGMPELVVSQIDDSQMELLPYIRVGRDLDSSGRVTNGWTDYMHGFQHSRFPGQISLSRPHSTGAMTLHKFEDFQIAVLVLHQVNSSFEITYRINPLTPSFLKTANSQPKVTELSDGCEECYTEENRSLCLNLFYTCTTLIDQVMVADTEEDPCSTTTRLNTIEDYDALTLLHTHKTDLVNQSLYCIGFQYLLDIGKSCETFHRGSVTSKGIKIAFENYFNESSPMNVTLSSTTLFYSAGVQHGGGSPMAVVIKISGKYNSYKAALRRAIRKLKSQMNFGHIYTFLDKRGGDYYVDINFNSLST